MKTIGIILIILGIVAFAYQGITYTSREKVIDVGSVEVTANKKNTIAKFNIQSFLLSSDYTILFRNFNRNLIKQMAYFWPLKIETLCLPSVLFASHQQQHYTAYERNTTHNRWQGNSICLFSSYLNWTNIDDFLSGLIGYTLIGKDHDPQNNENNTYCFHLIFPFSYLFKDIYLASRN